MEPIMERLNFLFVLVLFAPGVLSFQLNLPQAPVFGSTYFTQGLLSLPYAEILEPFTAYYDLPNNRSRVDYYGDMVLTYQLANLSPNGISLKVAYMNSDNGDPVRTCFQVNGTEQAAIVVQPAVPDLSQFMYVKTEDCHSELVNVKGTGSCQRFEHIETYGKKINKYTMWVTDEKPARPYHYEMKGYNSLFGSHYDKYEIYYTNYVEGKLEDSIFEFPTNLTCRSFPGPGSKHTPDNNPLHEFINGDDAHIHSAFDDFKNDYNVSYNNDTEHDKRKDVFRQNHRFVYSKNRQGLSFSLKLNHLADKTDNEIKILRGKLYSGVAYNGGKAFNKELYNKDVPDSIDWRLFGAVTPVKDQAVCGSCWSFGTTGTIEGTHFLKTGNLVRLSQQQLIDCSWTFQNNGCDGGEDFRAYAYIQHAGGLSVEEDYGSYLGNDGKCHDKDVNKTAHITGFVNVTSGDLDALRIASAKFGPISVGIDAAHKSFSFYSNGVYYDPECGNKPDNLDHSVLLVGYGVMNGQPYWLIKNSWSTYWGNNGYVLMSQKDNNCGVATEPTFVLM